MAMGNCDIFQELGDKCSYYLISIYKANIISKPHIRVRLSILSKFFCTFYILAGMRVSGASYTLESRLCDINTVKK